MRKLIAVIFAVTCLSSILRAQSAEIDSAVVSEPELVSENYQDSVEHKTDDYGMDSVLRSKPSRADSLEILALSANSTIDSLANVRPHFKPDPNKSVWYALLFPGLGQIYNRKYWKLPIVYGGVAGITYAITWNGKYYNDYYNAYRDFMDSNPNTNSYENLIPENYPVGQIESYLNSRQRTYRRNRDLSIIIGVAFYAITVVDAFVDAQLAEFDISPELSMKVTPKLMEEPQSKIPSMGCSLQVNF